MKRISRQNPFQTREFDLETRYARAEAAATRQKFNRPWQPTAIRFSVRTPIWLHDSKHVLRTIKGRRILGTSRRLVSAPLKFSQFPKIFQSWIVGDDKRDSKIES